MTNSSLAIFWMDFWAAKTLFSAAEKPKKGDNVFSLSGRRQVYLHPNGSLCGLLSFWTNMTNKSQNSSSLVFFSCRRLLLFLCCRNQSGSCLYRTSWVTNGYPTPFSFTGSKEHTRNVPWTDGGGWANMYSCIFTCFSGEWWKPITPPYLDCTGSPLYDGWPSAASRCENNHRDTTQDTIFLNTMSTVAGVCDTLTLHFLNSKLLNFT